MKAVKIFLLIIFLAGSGYSQNQDWTYRNPLPQNDFYAIKFFDQNTGYVCGSNGTILKNTTGSNNWITVQSNTTNNLYGLYFFDVNHGYVVGAGGLIMYTSDGGNNWTSVVTSNSFALRSITFVNSNTGFVAGDNGELYKTTSGITGFVPINVTTVNLHSVFATDSLRIYACGDSGKFLRTTNGGNNWTVQTVINYNLTSIFFTNALTGYLIANQSGSLKTIDGGITWSNFNIGYTSPSYAIKFINQNTGFAVGANMPILRTTNAGANWNPWCSDQLFEGNAFFDISPVDTGRVFTCGSRGWILKSIGSGYNGTSFHIGGSRFSLSSISFLNENTGEVVGNNQYLYTTNGGANWTINLVGLNTWFEGAGSITGARLFQPNSGYRTQFYGGMGFNTSSIQNSTDGGLTWNGNRSYSVTNGVPFLGYCEAEGVTYLVPSYRQVLKNTGSGWTTSLSAAYDIGRISFANANTGGVIGGGVVQGITRTTNGGTNWTFFSTGSLHKAYYIQMLQSGVGYIAGDSTLVMKTYDYGANWTLLSSNGNLSIVDINFADDNTGWYIGQTGSYPYTTGRLYYTPNGGANFMQLQSLQNFNVKGFSFVNAYTGYVCGDSGVVLKTTNGGLTFVDPTSSNIPDRFLLHQNYPNPFNPVTKIKFDIPLNKGGDQGLSVKLIIYDVLGKEVATLLNEQLQPGSYSVDWDASNYPSGVYFYKLEVGDFVQTKKMVLIK